MCIFLLHKEGDTAESREKCTQIMLKYVLVVGSRLHLHEKIRSLAKFAPGIGHDDILVTVIAYARVRSSTSVASNSSIT